MTQHRLNGETNNWLNRLILLGLAAILLVVTAWIYSFGLTGTWHFDDQGNLYGLADITDWTSWWHFVLSGIAGPTGRPLSLATFALQSEFWPDRPDRFLLVNIALHTTTALVALLFVRKLALVRGATGRAAIWLALFVGACWALSPFLISTNLLAIQRMTTLAALFTLAGATVYLYGRVVLARSPAWGAALIWSAIGGFTLLATFSKENGALLPACLLLMESMLFRGRLQWNSAGHRRLVYLALVTASAMVAAMIAYRGITGSFEFRDFNALERVLTEPRILWDYIYNLLIPNGAASNPFNDGFAKSAGLFRPWTTLLALIGLIAVIAILPTLYRRSPMAAFGIAWFLLGHVMESTILPLELYFAHRNYLPALGLYLALGALGMTLAGQAEHRRILAFGAVGYIAVFAFSLFSAASLWGRPMIAASVWAEQKPHSVRAAQYLASMHLNGGAIEAGLDVLERALEYHPDHLNLHLQMLLPCSAIDQRFDQSTDRALAILRDRDRIHFNEANTLHDLAQRMASGECDAMAPGILSNMLEMATAPGTRYQNTNTEHLLYYARAQLAQSQHRFEDSIRYLEKALALKKDPKTVIRIAYHYVQLDQPARAASYLRQALQNPPTGRIEAELWEREIGDYLSGFDSGAPPE